MAVVSSKTQETIKGLQLFFFSTRYFVVVVVWSLALTQAFKKRSIFLEFWVFFHVFFFDFVYTSIGLINLNITVRKQQQSCRESAKEKMKIVSPLINSL